MRLNPLLVGTGVLLVIAMTASFTPTPLYATYQAEWSISDNQVALAFAGYPVGVVAVLIGLGGLSDRLGRRRTLLLGAAVLVVALLVMGFAGNLATLIGGRIVQGAGAGLVISSAAAALMESHPGGPDRGSFVNTFCVSLGIAIGPVVAGSLASLSDSPLRIPYLVIAAGLVLGLTPLALARTDRALSGPVRIVQAVRVPRRLWRPFAVAAGAVLTTNMCMGMFGAFGPHITHHLGWTTEAASGRLVSLMLGAVMVAQLGGRRASRSGAMALGVVFAVAGWSATTVGVSARIPVAVVLGSAVLGAGAGLCLLGSAALIGAISPPGQRAELYSAYLLVAFTVLAGTAVGAGPILTRTSLPAVLTATTALSLLVAAWLLPAVRRLRREEST
nr:MAG: hypothetical protein DIU58_08065 [Sphaerobacter thermophilus]